ncbi:MAG: NADH-quinone oxidoreductase subunit J [Gemmataceae bacterium]|nr:NADH-quinone oxidoreductase subunit J [Gemmataceae bacterium]MDW8264049.1 NADH-quinone oxidoreductase subunit J [Gemmataceae bacterium]
MTLAASLFWLVAGVTAASAIGVVVTQHIVRAAVWLLFSLAGTAGIFFLLGADFVAATQVFVYVGGTLVLVVFGVMLTAQGPFVSMKTSAVEWAVATVVGLLLFGVLVVCVMGEPAFQQAQPLKADQNSSTVLGKAFLGVVEATAEAPLTGVADRAEPGARTRVAYLLPFEIVSVHLLVVLVGAAYLARAKRRRMAA